ncbi:MAG: zinc ribbon domain-containing protein [Bacilli bacterium]|nr:zinc ribbon domain-containing protein [Bacilli bacterium]
MNKKICPNCGTELIEDFVFCTNCGTKIKQDNNVNEEKNTQSEVNNEQVLDENVVEEVKAEQSALVEPRVEPRVQPSNSYKFNNQADNNSNATLIGTLSLVLYFAGSAVVTLISYFFPGDSRDAFMSLSGFCPLAGIVLMIIGRVKYPTNKFLKVVMWIIIGSIILGLFLFILFVIWCYITCSTMDTSGCG